MFGKAKTLSSRNADIRQAPNFLKYQNNLTEFNSYFSNGKRLQEQEEIELVDRK